MNQIILEDFEALRSLAEKHGVYRLYLFGSGLSNDFDAVRSDVDFLVEFEAGTVGGRANQYFGLLEDLETLFGRPVDLVEPEAIRNPYFREEVEKTKRPLYDAA